MTVFEKYKLWLEFDESTKAELSSIFDKKEIEDRFYKELEFGTGGLRGVMGAGSNRMNKYTVGKATLGLARYLKSQFGNGCSVAVAFDVHAPTFRHKAFSEYKAQRKGMPDELRQQMPILKDILSAMKIKKRQESLWSSQKKMAPLGPRQTSSQ